MTLGAVRTQALILMQVTNISGESTVEGFSGWTEVSSMSWGVGRAVSPPRLGAERDTSAPQFSEISISKNFDKTSPLFFIQAAAGEPIPVVEFHFTRSDFRDTQVVYYKVKLTDVLVSSYSQTSGGDQPTETISFNFATIEVTAVPPQGTGAVPVVRGWNLATGRPL